MNTIKLVLATIMIVILSGCAGTNQPTVGSGEVNDKTLNGNAIDFFTLIRVQNNYGTSIAISDSDNGKVTR